MILPDLTPAVMRALKVAGDLAGASGAGEATPRHLLLGLIEEEDGRAAQLLREQGLHLEMVRSRLGVQAVEPISSAVPPAPSARLEHLLLAARRLALDITGETHVASEHLLLALLRQEDDLREKLAELGLSLTRLEAGLPILEREPLPLDEPLALQEPAEQIDSARILDANANRAREALRVLEDFCRFALDDAFLSKELKALRHELTEILARFSPHLFIEARETLRDVGTTIRTPTEGERQSLRAVVQANCKRLQEALRSLEEYGKLNDACLGRAFEALRYRAYTLEKALLLGDIARQLLADARLYVLVGASQCVAELEWTIAEAVAGGAQIIQLREKGVSDRELLEQARRVRKCTRAVEALFIMNDRPDIARLVEADGVHVGQEELSVKDVRRIVGPDLLIGVSTHDLEQMRQAIRDGDSYVGIGPVFPSGTKNFEALAGLDFVRQAAAETSLPAFAIGGITPGNVEQVVAAGLRRVAVGQIICQADEPRRVAGCLRRALDS